MALQSNPYILWQLIPGLILLWIGLYIQSRPIKKRESNTFSIFMFAGAIWALASAIQLITPNYEWQKIWNDIAYIGILIVPTAWFLLAVKMTGFNLERIQRIEKWLWAMPIFIYLVILTNDFHKLFFTAQTMETVAGFASLNNEFGPLFYLHTVYSYILLFAGTIILGISVIRYFPKYGSRAYGILVGVLAPLIANVYYLFGDIPTGFPDPTPIAFTVSGIAFAWAIIGGRMLEIVPLAHDAIVQNLSTGILVLDSDKNILNINPAAAEILGIPDHMDQGGALSELIKTTPAIKPLAATLDSQHDSNTPLEITIQETRRTFDVTVTPIERDDKGLAGWLVQFSDISQRLQVEANLATTQETFESVLDTLQDGYFEADPTGVITYANQALIHTLGFENHADMVGKNFRRFIHPKSIRNIYESFHKLYETKQPQKSFEYYYTRRDGEERIAEIAVSPVIKGNEIIGSRGIIRDITDRVAADRQLRLLGQVVKQMKDAVILTDNDAESRIRYVNEAFSNLYGYAEDEVLGKSSWTLYAGDKKSRDDITTDRLNAVRHRGEYQVEYQDRRKDGEFFWVSNTSSEIHLGEEDKMYDLGIIRDITTRVEAENEISEQRDLLNSLLQYAPMAIVILDLEFKVTNINPAFEKLFGYAQSEIIGVEIDDFLSTPEIVEEMRSLTEKGMQERIYFVGKRKKKDGALVDVEIFSEPFFVGEEKFGLLVFYNDISERLKAEAELDQTHATYRAVLDTLQDPYFEADPKGVITFVNQAFWRTLGYSSKDEVIGKNFRHVTDRKSVREVFNSFQTLYETQKNLKPFDYHYRRKDGSVLVAEIVVSPILDDGQVVGTRGIIRDISVRIRAEEVLQEAKEAAEHRAGELSAINRVATIVNRSLDLNAILQSICIEFTKIFPARNTGIALLDEEETHLEVIAFHAVDPEEKTALGVILDLEGNLASQEVLKTKKTVVLQDAQTDPRTKPIHELSKKRGSKSFMIVPLSSRGQVVGTIGMPAKDPEYVFKENEIELAETIASQIAAAIDNARLYGQTEMALGVAERDLEIGREIQSGFFPDVLPEIPGWEISAYFQAARQVAGDFYDIYQFRDSKFTAFIIADVCDKGVGAALFMVLFRSLLRAFSEIEINEHNIPERLKEIVLNTNNFIAEFHGQSNMFATLFFGILDPDQGNLFYINGGHEPPIVMNKDGKLMQRLMPTGPAVGMFTNMVFEVAKIQFEKGDILVGFTDGATDAKNSSADLFSEERLLRSIQAPWTSIFSMVFELYTELRNHIGDQDQYDDITLISFRRKHNMDADYHAICRIAKMDILDELRDFVEAAAIKSGVDAEKVFAFKLATEEVCTNIIQYGFEGQEPGFISLAFEKKDGKAILSIWDDGIYFSPDQVDTPDINANWESRQIGGLGIYLVKELMDNVSYNIDENNNNVLILEKLLSANKLAEEQP